MYVLNNYGGVIRLSDGAVIPTDSGNTDYQAYQDWLDQGNQPQPVLLSAADLELAVVSAVQQRLDEFARTRGYDGILSACTYAASGVPKFAAEGSYCLEARDSQWAKCYEIVADVQAGTRAAPGVDQVLAELPALSWPA